MQVSKGTSGKNMTYKMIVSLVGPDQGGFINLGAKLVVSPTGCDKTDDTSLGEVGTVRYVIDNIFESQGGANDMAAATVINVAEKIKTKNPHLPSKIFRKRESLFLLSVKQQSLQQPVRTIQLLPWTIFMLVIGSIGINT
jgi:hypothetical protein